MALTIFYEAVTRQVAWIFAVLFAGLSIFTMVALIYWAFIDTDPPIIYSGQALTDHNGIPTNKFKAGDTMLLTRSFCVGRQASVDIDRRLVSLDGSNSYFVSASTTVLPRGCRRDTRSIELPKSVPPGEYNYIASVSYENNFLTKGVIEAPTVWVKIEP